MANSKLFMGGFLPMPETGLDPREFARQNAAGPVGNLVAASSGGNGSGGSSGGSGSGDGGDSDSDSDSDTTQTVTPVKTVTAPGASLDMTFASNGDITYDVTPNAALTLSLSGGAAGTLSRLTLILRQPSSGGFAVALPTARYQGGEKPVVSTSAGTTTVISYLTDDGSKTIYGGV
ncbi:hypothetical protein AA0472_1262 [Acetobacter estunensis NRIC 0472]|uniref:Uncharacterized protein n=1 Tax=Acetobacter estunensis TaxID=104097 RepID=A0A967B849_9PROT|nr:hypothetical protein [Acetobacter estunensis]NHO54899.1 hypothetical protein [Acetobacter estunensis]GBQ23944.1 hypothetical protein AA0472_1262 [Acetobacter estunensis NRIC 0472]